MIVKALEVHDRATFLPVVAVEMTATAEFSERPSLSDVMVSREFRAQRYLLRRCGFDEKNRAILLTRMEGGTACHDVEAWGDRTFCVAHGYIVANWDDLRDGDVIDVEYILGEIAEPKRSEREE